MTSNGMEPLFKLNIVSEFANRNFLHFFLDCFVVVASICQWSHSPCNAVVTSTFLAWENMTILLLWWMMIIVMSNVTAFRLTSYEVACAFRRVLYISATDQDFYFHAQITFQRRPFKFIRFILISFWACYFRTKTHHRLPHEKTR